MARRFLVRTTPAFEREVRRLAKRYPDLRAKAARTIEILEEDPANLSRTYNIEKLHGVPSGEGQYRLRLGDWRFRYDIHGAEVVLHLCRRRPEAYR